MWLRRGRMKEMLRNKHPVVVALLCILGVVGCYRKEQGSPLDVSSQTFSGDTLRTLQSLRKVNDFPLYVMSYYGNYVSSSLVSRRHMASPEEVMMVEQGKTESWQCTGFVGYGNPGAPVFGRNFDWRNRAALILFTHPPGGHASVSMVDISYCGYGGDPDLSTLASRENLLKAPLLPFDGMNDAGVAIGMMAVPHVQPPFDPSRRSLNDLAIMRLVLDRAATTRQAVAFFQSYNIVMNEVPLHYFVADRSGESAVIEFVHDRIEVRYNEGAPFQISTNFIQYEVLPNLSGHCWRYDLACSLLVGRAGTLTMDDARDLLRTVSQTNTMWSSVYGLATGEIQVVPGRRFDSAFRSTLNEWRE